MVERLLSFKDRNRIHDFRFDIWKIAYRAYTKRPLLGWGNANFQNAYQANIIVNTDNSDSYFREVESSHNIFMDILSEWGLIGIILTITSLWYVFRLKGNIFDCYIKLSILVVFIKGMFEFYSVVNWIFLAILVGLLLRNSKKEIQSRLFCIGFKVFLLLIALIGALYISKIALSEEFEKQAKTEGNLSTSIIKYEKALKYNPYKQSMNGSYIGLLYWSRDYDKFKSTALESKKQFDDFKINFYLAQYYLMKNDDEAFDYFHKAAALNKRDPQTFHNLALLYYKKAEYEKAFGYFEYTVGLDSKNFSDDYVYLAQMAMEKGDYKQARKYIDKAAPSENQKRLRTIIDAELER